MLIFFPEILGVLETQHIWSFSSKYTLKYDWYYLYALFLWLFKRYLYVFV